MFKQRSFTNELLLLAQHADRFDESSLKFSVIIYCKFLNTFLNLCVENTTTNLGTIVFNKIKFHGLKVENVLKLALS